jgi:two-component system OmpR family sensor kinase
MDHGPGIPEEVAARIFERFYRADRSRGRATGGTGLGLSIVSAIVAAHQGTVQYRPTEGGGATFEVRIPVQRPLAAEPGADEPDPAVGLEVSPAG